MKFVIIGAGGVGVYLAKALSLEEHDVVIIDSNPSALKNVEQIADAATYLGSAIDEGVLSSFVEEETTLIAVSDRDETNLIACAIAKNLGFSRTIARIRNPSFFEQGCGDCERLFFVDYRISAESIIAHDIFKQMTQGGSVRAYDFAGGAVQMRSFRMNENVRDINRKLSSLGSNRDLIIAFIYRASEKLVIFYEKDDEILPGDEIALLGKLEVMLQIDTAFGLPAALVSSATIAGGTRLGEQLALLLLSRGIRVKVIEAETKSCQRLASLLPKATILQGNLCDPSFFKEEGIGGSDAFVACGNEDEKNIVSSALAKEAGCGAVWTVLSNSDFAPLLCTLGIAFIPDEKKHIADQILKYTAKERIIAITSLYEERARIVEIKISHHAKIAGLKIEDAQEKFPARCSVAFIQRGRDVQIAKNSTVLLPGDRVIILCDAIGLHHLTEIF